MFKRILIAYDGSQPSTKAFEQAMDLAAKYEAEAHVIFIVRPPDFGDDVETEAILENAQERIRNEFAQMEARAGKIGVPSQFSVLVGHPAEQIVRYAEEKAIDLIIVGHRGKGLFERWLLGSVSRAVIAYAHCAVLVIR